MPESTFYSAAASASFALLGFWWLVVVQRYKEWLGDFSRMRQAYSISLYFMLPAMMSLGSLVGPPGVWRLAFGLSAALGLAEVLAALRRSNRDRLASRVKPLVIATIPLYAAIGAIATHPALLVELGIGLKPLETEAIGVVVLLLTGVHFAWALLFESPGESGTPGP